jgi:hypothetical protein
MIAPGQEAQGTRFHLTHVAGVDEQRLTRAVASAAPLVQILPGLVPCDEPQANRNPCREEELWRHCDNAVHQIGVDDLSADVAFASGRSG